MGRKGGRGGVREDIGWGAVGGVDEGFGLGIAVGGDEAMVVDWLGGAWGSWEMGWPSVPVEETDWWCSRWFGWHCVGGMAKIVVRG